MNFVIKNIAWLLLVVFFLFMLFIISSNEGEKKYFINSEITLQEEEAKEIEDLDSLVEMVGETTKFLEKGKGKIQVEKEEIKEEQQGFFSRVFGKKENTGKNKEEDKNLEKESRSSTQGNNNIKKNREVSENGSKQKLGNLKKYSEIQQEKVLKTQYTQENIYPGVNLETAIGKKFEVGVYSLKLNNAFFNETLAYMLKGDKVTQLTKENSYGCFQVELEKSKKRGYVCKKYLQNTIKAKKIEEGAQQSRSNIGDIITIEVEAVTFANNILLLKGDTVDQMTNIDTQGCFIAHVYNSSIQPKVVPVGKICYKDIKGY